MLDCCSCFRRKKDRKAQTLQKNEEKHQNKQQQNHQQIPQQPPINNNVFPLDAMSVISALQLKLEAKERSQSFPNYQKEVVDYLQKTNPVFKKTRKIKFPSPFIKYKVIPYLHQKQALDVATTNDPGQDFYKNTLIRYNYHGGPNQLFFFKEKSPKVYYIINVSKGFTVEVPESKTENGVHIIADPRNDKQNQVWQLVETEKQSTYRIKSFCGKYLTVTEGLLQSIKVTQEEYNGSKNQMWILTPS